LIEKEEHAVKRALIMVAKRPEAGLTKTRLSPPLSPQQAAELYACFILDTVALMTRLDSIDPIVAYAPRSAEAYFRERVTKAFALLPQVGNGLGERLNHVLNRCLQVGYDQVAVMNSDSPTMPPHYLHQAFAALDNPAVDVALGPTDDGGYYLIGLKRPCTRLFDVKMSTPTVLQETLALARAEGLRAECLPTWYDVDTVHDLKRLTGELANLPAEVAMATRGFLMQWQGQEPTDLPVAQD
jgi:rSAM/selenodomain-associated transferase 1